MAVVDYFIKIDGIEGESQDDKHKNEIELDSFSWGASNSGTSAMGGGGGAGKVHISDFVVMKHIDKASPKILEACNSGKHISSAVIVCRKQGGSQQEYLKITLSDVLVSSYDTMSGAPAGRRQHSPLTATGGRTTSQAVPIALPIPMEQIHLNFGKIEYEYREQDSKGGMKGPVKTGWDVKANKVT